LRANAGGELAGAIETALANHDGPTLIECLTDRDDCTSDSSPGVTELQPRTPVRNALPCDAEELLNAESGRNQRSRRPDPSDHGSIVSEVGALERELR
jgi:hypothetical protein